VQLLADSLSIVNEHLREHYELHMNSVKELEGRSRVFTELDGENAKVDGMFQATNALQYGSEQFILSELWHTASTSRHKVFELRDKVFGADGERLPRGMHGKFNRLQWSIDGKKRLVDHLGRTESEAEEERKIQVDDEEEEEEEEVEHQHAGIRLARFFTADQ
jgi:hypothetical protein